MHWLGWLVLGVVTFGVGLRQQKIAIAAGHVALHLY